jgi:solute:Na+ symporter, SSS family
VPVILGLVYTRTPWWSGMLAFSVGVLAVVGASIAANLSQGLPADSFGAVFASIDVSVLGIEMGRYELNTLVGVVASTACFFGSAVFSGRTGAFADRISHLERDLRTPAHATHGKLDLRGLQAYRLAGILAVVIGVLLVVMVVPTMTTGGYRLNLLAGTLAMLLGFAVIVGVRRYSRRVAEESEHTVV